MASRVRSGACPRLSALIALVSVTLLAEPPLFAGPDDKSAPAKARVAELKAIEAALLGQDPEPAAKALREIRARAPLTRDTLPILFKALETYTTAEDGDTWRHEELGKTIATIATPLDELMPEVYRLWKRSISPGFEETWKPGEVHFEHHDLENLLQKLGPAAVPALAAHLKEATGALRRRLADLILKLDFHHPGATAVVIERFQGGDLSVLSEMSSEAVLTVMPQLHERLEAERIKPEKDFKTALALIIAIAHRAEKAGDAARVVAPWLAFRETRYWAAHALKESGIRDPTLADRLFGDLKLPGDQTDYSSGDIQPFFEHAGAVIAVGGRPADLRRVIERVEAEMVRVYANKVKRVGADQLKDISEECDFPEIFAVLIAMASPDTRSRWALEVVRQADSKRRALALQYLSQSRPDDPASEAFVLGLLDGPRADFRAAVTTIARSEGDFAAKGLARLKARLPKLNAEARRWVAWTLAETPSKRTVALLRELNSDGDAVVRQIVLEKLPEQDPVRAGLVKTGLADESATVRQAAVERAGDSAEAKATVLKLCRKDPNPNVRQAAFERLVWYRDAELVPVFVDALAAPERRDRALVALSLVSISDPAMLAKVFEHWPNDPTDDKATKIAKVLAEASGKAREAVDETIILSLERAANITDNAPAALRNVAAGKTPIYLERYRKRGRAGFIWLWCAGESTPALLETLVGLLGKGDEEGLAASEILRHHPKAIPLLLEVLDEGKADLRFQQAAEALRDLAVDVPPHPAPRAALEQRLTHKSPATRYQAARLLGLSYGWTEATPGRLAGKDERVVAGLLDGVSSSLGGPLPATALPVLEALLKDPAGMTWLSIERLLILVASVDAPKERLDAITKPWRGHPNERVRAAASLRR